MAGLRPPSAQRRPLGPRWRVRSAWPPHAWLCGAAPDEPRRG